MFDIEIVVGWSYLLHTVVAYLALVVTGAIFLTAHKARSGEIGTVLLAFVVITLRIVLGALVTLSLYKLIGITIIT